MSKADDELFGLKSSRTGEYLHSKSADEMFEDEGMWLEYEDQSSMMRKNDDNKVININKITREVDCFGYYTQETDTITLNELKAIYKYCQERGWIGGEDE